MRIVFMGTAEFGVPALRAISGRHEVAAVVTRPDAVCGRGLRLQCPPVGNAGADLGIPVLAPRSLSDPEFLGRLREFGADAFFVVAFRILPPAVFTMPPKGTVNLHGSILPDYRGAAPIQHAVLNGDVETGLTTFYIDEAVDTGDMIFSERVAIDPDETAGELRKRLSVIGADIALRTMDAIEAGTAPRIPQPMTGGRPAPKLHKRDGRIDWAQDARSVHNHVRGMNPEPGAFTPWCRGPLKIHRTILADEASTGVPGTVAETGNTGLTIQCGRGRVRIVEVQPPGKRPMDGASFVRGYRIGAGALLPLSEECAE